MTNSDCPDGTGPIKPTAKSCQGPSGNEVDRIGSGGSGRATGWHPWHAWQCLSAALPIPGHHTLVLRFYLVPITPKWPSWASAKVLGCSWLGIITHVPLSTSWPMTHNSPATVIYCLHFSNRPVAIAFLTSFSSSSSAEASSISRVVSAVGVALTATNLTYSSVHRWWLSGSTLLWSSHDNGSAMFSRPGLCITLKSYGCNLRTHRSIRAHGLDRGPYMTSKGLWSVSTTNFIAYT